MTQNIEERTLAATSTMEGAAKAMDEIANTDKTVETPVGPRKSFPKLSREIEENGLKSLKLGAANHQGTYAAGVFYNEPNWTYTYNGQQWGLSKGFDLSTLPYEATQADPNDDSNLAVRGEASQEYVQTETTRRQGESLGGGVFSSGDGILKNGMYVPAGTANLRTSGGDFLEETIFPILKKDGTVGVSGLLSNLNLTIRPYSATIGNDDVWLLDIKYYFPGKGLNIMLFWPDRTGAQESSVQFQAWASFCINNPRKPVPGYIPTANNLFRLSNTIEVIKKDTEVCYGVWEVFGDGGGSAANADSGILVDKNVPMFRICQQADGQYPEGDDFVIDPLHYLRRVHFHDFNCRGVLNGLSSFVQGRGVYLSTFERLGGYNHEEWVRLGNLTDIPKLSPQGYELDYCEGNTFSKCSVQRVNKQIRVKNPDGLVIKDCPRLGYGNSTWTEDGYVLYTSGGNDTVRFEGNIVRCTSIVSNYEAPPQIFKLNGTRGLDLSGNHFERINGRIMNAVGLESFTTAKTNLFAGLTQTTTTLFKCDSCPVGFSFIFEGNNWSMPKPSDLTFRFNGTNVGWVTRIFENNVTTMLGGGTVYELTSNVIASNEGYGSWKQPIRWLNRYLWMTPAGNLRSSSSVPTSVSDGEPIAPYNPNDDVIVSENDPTSSDIPARFGQEWLNTNSKVWFKATSDGGDWKKITNEDPAP